jgi:outer membrane protein TolC
MKSLVTLVVLALLPVLAADGSDAVPPAPPVEQLVAQALERAPPIAAARERVAAAAAVVDAAAVLPDPMLEVSIDNMGVTSWTVGKEEMSMVGVSYVQPLLYPGKRDARRASASAEVAPREAEVAALGRRVALEVRLAYSALYVLDCEAASLGAARELLDLLTATVTTRYAVGEVDQSAVIKAQLEQTRLAERLDDLAAERAALVARLNVLRDLPGAEPLGVVAALPPVGPPAQPWDRAIAEGSPAVAVLQHELTAAERRVEMARADLKPNLLVGGGLAYRGDFDPAVSLRFGIELPARRDTNQRARLTGAEHEVARLRAERHAAEAEARGAAARLAADWQRANSQLERYREAFLPQTSAAIDAARASYLAGRGDFSTVLEDFRAWLDARVELARREAGRYAVWAELVALLPEPAGSAAQEVNS